MRSSMYPSYTSIYQHISSYNGIWRYMSGYQGVRIPDDIVSVKNPDSDVKPESRSCDQLQVEQLAAVIIINLNSTRAAKRRRRRSSSSSQGCVPWQPFIWNLVDLRYRRSDLRYRDTILQVEPLISKVGKWASISGYDITTRYRMFGIRYQKLKIW